MRAYGYASGIDIVFSGPITAYNTAIHAYARYKDVNVNHTGNLTSTDSGSGVHADAYFGQVDVIVHGNISATDVGYGIWAHSQYGPVYVHAFGDINSAQNAIRGAAPGKVDIFHYDGHLISTDNGVNAVTGRSYQSHVAIHNHGDVDANGHGLAAYAYTDANVYQFGNINSHNAYRSGIAATSQQGNIEIYLNGDITAFYDGIHAFAYNGDVYIHTPGNIDAGHKGIYAYAQHSAVVVHNGDISLDTSHPGSSEQAVDVHAVTGAASVTLDNGSVHGITAGVRIDAAVDAYLTIGPNGSLTSDNDLAVQMTGAANANVYISGYVRGYMQFDTDDDVYVNDDGTWRPTGTTDFDFFGGGGTDRVFNRGVIRTSDFGAGGPENVFFENLEEFHNGSTTGGPGLITMVNNDAGDSFVINYSRPARRILRRGQLELGGR